MFKSTDDFKSSRLSVLVYGQSGVGKTSLVKDLDSPLVVNFENGLLSIADSKVDVYDCTVDRNGNPLSRAMRFKKLMHALEKVLNQEAQKKKYKWLVFDSLTEIAQCLVESLKGKYADASDTFKMWGEYNDSATDLCKTLRDYAPYNILILALDSVDKDDVGRRYKGIDMNGKISSRVPALFDEVFYMALSQDEEKKNHRVFVTNNQHNTVSKDRSGRLEPIEAADLKKVINKIKGGE